MTNPRNYYRPQTLAEALQLAGQPDTVALAGGAMTLDALDVSFSTFVDLQDIAELKKIEASPAGHTIGGAVTLQQVVDLPDLHPVIRRSLTRAIPLNHRNGTTVAESLLQAQRFPEWMTVLAALDVGIEQIQPDGTGEFRSMTDRLRGQGKDKLGTGIISRIHLSMYEGHKQALGASFVARTPADAPIVCVAAYVRLDAAGDVDIEFPMVYGLTVDPLVTGFSWIETSEESPMVNAEENAALTETRINALVNGLQLEVSYSDYRGSAEYRGEMAKVCLKRALMECLGQL